MSATDMLGAIVATVLAGRADGRRRRARARLRPGRRGRGLLDLLPARPVARRRRGAPLPAGPGVIAMGETMVRMGELAVSAGRRRRARLARPGLVHRPRAARPPGSGRRPGPRRAARARGARSRARPGKFADTAVPALVDAMEPLGARRPLPRGRARGRREHVRLRRARASTSASATRPPCAQELARVRIPVAAAETGGAAGPHRARGRRQRRA